MAESYEMSNGGGGGSVMLEMHEQLEEEPASQKQQGVGKLVQKRPQTLGLEPLKMPVYPPGYEHSPSLGGASTASSLAAARLIKPVTIGFKNLSYSVRTGIFRKGELGRFFEINKYTLVLRSDASK